MLKAGMKYRSSEAEADIELRTIDPCRFNIEENDAFVCPCCGYPGAFAIATYDETGGIIGAGICLCCFWEPGFDDNPMASADACATILESLRRYRRTWIDENHPWRDTKLVASRGWNARAQLERLFALAPHVV
jgi:hypothetical protein